MMRRVASHFSFAALIGLSLSLSACTAGSESATLQKEISKRLDANALLKAEHITLRFVDFNFSQGSLVLEMATGDRAVRQAIKSGKDVQTDTITPRTVSNPEAASYVAYTTKRNVDILKAVLPEIKSLNGIASLKLTASSDTPLDRAEDLRNRGLSAQALEAYRKLADRGDAEAQYSVGQHYLVGLGVSADFIKALEYMQKSATQGFAPAMHNLGAIYQFGQPGVTPDQNKALEWYQKAADSGQKYSQVNLALMYYFAQGVPRDYMKAREWFTLAAEQDDPRALIYLGRMNENGRGAPRDFIKTVALYQKAADLDSVEGYSALAWLYATCEDAKYLDGAKAIQNAEKAVSMIAKAPEFADAVWSAYAATQARLGQFDKAIEASQKSLDLIEKSALYTGEMRVKALKEEKEHLETYKKHQPYVNHPESEDDTSK